MAARHPEQVVTRGETPEVLLQNHTTSPPHRRVGAGSSGHRAFGDCMLSYPTRTLFLLTPLPLLFAPQGGTKRCEEAHLCGFARGRGESKLLFYGKQRGLRRSSAF